MGKDSKLKSDFPVYQWKLMELKRIDEDRVKTSFPSLELFFTLSLHLENMMCVVSHLKKQ